MPVVKSQSPSNSKPKNEHKTRSAVDRISDINFDTSTGIKALIYGQSGTGKTTLWATFPGPILVVVCSGGRNPGELRSVNTPEYRKKIKQCVISTRDEFRELIEYQAETDTFTTLVLDHCTGLQDVTLRDILGIDELPAQMGWGDATQQQWGKCALQMKETLRAALSLSCNVVITAQERSFTPSEDTDIAVPYVGAALAPSVTGWLNPACDYIVQTFKKQKEVARQVTMAGKTTTQVTKVKGVDYCLRVGPDPTYITKFRLPKGMVKLPDYIVDPDFDKMLKLMQGKA